MIEFFEAYTQEKFKIMSEGLGTVWIFTKSCRALVWFFILQGILYEVSVIY